MSHWRTGDPVRMMKLPDWLGQLPEDSRRLFQECLDKVFTVEEVEEDGVLILDVSSVGVPLLGGTRHVIMVDPTDVASA